MGCCLTCQGSRGDRGPMCARTLFCRNIFFLNLKKGGHKSKMKRSRKQRTKSKQRKKSRKQKIKTHKNSRYRATTVTEEDLLLFPGENVALKCFTSGCSRCSEFDVEHRDDFERNNLEHVRIIPWDCSDPHKRSFALKQGVETVPSYLKLGAEKRVFHL